MAPIKTQGLRLVPQARRRAQAEWRLASGQCKLRLGPALHPPRPALCTAGFVPRECQHFDLTKETAMPKQTLEAVQRALQGEWPNIESRDINNGVQTILPEGTKVNAFTPPGRFRFKAGIARKRNAQSTC